jgi:hypothetical protein
VIRGGAATAAAAALVLSGSASAGTVALPSTRTALTPVPPLSSLAAVAETLLPGAVLARQRVTVALDEGGRPVGVVVRHRIVVRGTGDYSFALPAPYADVHAGPGSVSEPGFRRDAVVWQGFSFRSRVLESIGALRVGAAAPRLPLRISVTTTVGGRPLEAGERRDGSLAVVLRLTNVTAVSVQAAAARFEPRVGAQILDQVREELAQVRDVQSRTVTVRGAATGRTLVVSSPLRVEGELRLDARALRGVRASGGTVVRRGGLTAVRFARDLGDGDPLSVTIRVTGVGDGIATPRLRLTAKPVPPLATLRPPGAQTWSALARRRRLDGARLFDLVTTTLLAAARAHQYDTFVANPGTPSKESGVYVFRTASSGTRRISEAPVSSGDAWGVLAIVAVGAAAGLAAGALLVAWAHL